MVLAVNEFAVEIRREACHKTNENPHGLENSVKWESNDRWYGQMLWTSHEGDIPENFSREGFTVKIGLGWGFPG
jgi:hypothetical protein